MEKSFPLHTRRSMLIWLVLVTLTAVTYLVGEAGLGGRGIMLLVLAVTLFKSHLVVGHFMGLRDAGLLWRMIMGGYLLVVGGMIAIAYQMSIQ